MARRRRNPEMLEANPRRRRRGKRRRYYGGRRRRNPSGGASLSRVRNNAVGMNEAFHILPPATAGVWAARWAVKQAGEFEDGEPGLKHAFAIWLAASWGSELIGSVFGSGASGYAKVAALGFGGDLFLRKRFMKDSEWVQKEISLAGADDPVNLYDQGRSYSSMGAMTMTDAVGNRYVQTSDGWALADDSGTQLYQDEAGNIFAMGAFEANSPLGAFESTSAIGALGRVRPSQESSFGYA